MRLGPSGIRLHYLPGMESYSDIPLHLILIESPEATTVCKRATGADGSCKDTESKDKTDVEIEMTMGKHVGLTTAVSLIVGSVIGSGIFISPKGVLEDTGSVALCLIVWAGSGIIALLGGLVYAELGMIVKKSGGEYAYLRQAFGNVFAYLYAWTSIMVIKTSSIAVISLTFAEYVDTLFEMCGHPEIPKKLVAAVALVTVALVNGYSTNLAARVQIVFTVAKVGALIVIIVGGMVKLAEEKMTIYLQLFLEVVPCSHNPDV
ncbi:b(0,+)-type amino acid transporter 1-like [Gigantopelta aegis]|uniref:b(0,+)-type amino acid transporter 1-like n=1 Tax=Gigantopelta aegis TaxID=1735272 RepID=UPI001B88C407|nr:b(0,+)-type amino acid transporter 1-like [Gigantopelta aegis]